ncbi:MAG: hydrogenase/urease maturation nickel metallochaperone HypA, partial [Desulfotignum sp.]
MHEMGIAQELVRIALEALPKDLAAPQVASVNLKIGKLAAVVPDS